MPGGTRGTRWARQAGLLAALGLLLGACGFAPAPSFLGEPRTPHPTYKIGAPYTVKGVTYHPHVDYAFDRVGVASWYGEQFQGRYTANGEVFDLNGVTAAHTTLPLRGMVGDGQPPATVVAAAAPAPAAIRQTASAPARRHFFVEDPVYHVQAGPVASRSEADGLRARLIANGYRDARVVID